MILNRKELRKIIYDFNSISNRLLQANFEDYNGVLAKFIIFLKTSPVIYDYIVDCGVCEQDLEQEFKEVSSSYGGCIFLLGESDEEEVRNVFAILCYIVDNNLNVHHGVAFGYSSSNKYQDKIKGFNDRVVMVLVRHIERYLTKIGIDMGVDEKVSYSITVHNGQVNIANDNASITATSTTGVDEAQLTNLIQSIRSVAKELSEDEGEILNSSLEVVEEEIKSGHPRKGFLKTAITGMNAVKGTVELASAIKTLVQYIQPFL